MRRVPDAPGLLPALPQERLELAHDPAAERFFAPNDRGRWQADLYGLARQSLSAAGVDAVSGGGFCTFDESRRFFSHRREAPCGRMATMVWLDAPRVGG